MSRATVSMIEHRTQALATVFLTGEGNVEVIPFREWDGLEMICRILPQDEDVEMIFGVIHAGIGGPIVSPEWAETWLNTHSGVLKAGKRYPFPVLVLLFSMPSDEGVYSWRIEPVLEDGEPALVLHERFSCEKATRASLDSILEKIRSWYDAYYRQVSRVER